MNTLIYIAAPLLGLLIGSFLNALVWRTRTGVSILSGRSQCTVCTAQIRWYDNIPVVSYLVLRGTCRDCQQPISPQYPIVEGVCGLLFLLTMYAHGGVVSWRLGADFLAVSILLFVFVYDALYMEIPDRASLWPAFFFFLLHLATGWRSVTDMFIGVCIGAGFFLVQYLVSRGRWIGGGDVRLGVLLGVLLGWQLTVLTLFLAYIVGAAVAIGLLILEKKRAQQEIAFGTFLSAAAFVALVSGDQLVTWYLGVAGL